MFIEKQIKKSGDSFVVYIPKRIIELSQLKLNDKVKISSNGKSITIEKIEEK